MIPVLLINFKNTTTKYDQDDFESLLFGRGVQSLKDYYEEVSYGAFSVSGGVLGWYTAQNNHAHYGSNEFSNDKYPAKLVSEAVAGADQSIDFSPYDLDGDCYVDAVAVVHQGAGEEASGNANDIWSHRWNLNGAAYYGDGSGAYTTNDACLANPSLKVKVDDYIIMPEQLYTGISTMGVFAHEYGHSLGLPDLYDTDYSSSGVGDWSLMAGGSWGTAPAGRPGDSPSHMDPWSKYRLGWINPVQVSDTLVDQSIEQVQTSGVVYQLLNGSPSQATGEYFLVENRQKVKFDVGLPGAGLLIWHIDENKGSNNFECYPGGPPCVTSHYKVAVVQADGQWDLEQGWDRGDADDPYPGMSDKRAFDGTSSPDSHLYSGTPSRVSITNISDSADVMTATLSVGSISTFSASGIIKDGDGAGVPGVTLEFSLVSGSGLLPASTETNQAGSWNQTGFQAGTTYRVTPSKVGYAFKPAFIDLSSARSDLDFTTHSAPGSLRVNLSPSEAMEAGAQWRVDGGAWNAGGVTIPNLAGGEHRVDFRSIPKWEKPQSRTVTIASGQTTIIEGIYATVPVVSLVVNDHSASEAGTDKAVLTVGRSGSTESVLIVHYKVGGTAKAGVDYKALTGSITIEAAQQWAPIVVTPMNDTIPEKKETVTVALLSGSSYRRNADRKGTIVILDNEKPRVSIRATEDRASESGGKIGVFKVHRKGKLKGDLMVKYTLKGTAQAGVDYKATAGFVIIPDGSASAEIEIVPKNDRVKEKKESVTAVLATSSDYTVDSIKRSAALTLKSDD